MSLVCGQNTSVSDSLRVTYLGCDVNMRNSVLNNRTCGDEGLPSTSASALLIDIGLRVFDRSMSVVVSGERRQAVATERKGCLCRGQRIKSPRTAIPPS